QNFNQTNTLITNWQTTDDLGRYHITLQPWEYKNVTLNETVWCNATMGDLRGFNTTTIAAWWWWLFTYGLAFVNSSSWCNITLYPPNITVNKTVDFAVASPGQELIYTIWVNNSDTWNATTVWLNDTLPTGIIYNGDTSASAVGIWASSVTHNSWGQIHNWTFTDVMPGNHSFLIFVTINGTVTNGTVLENWIFCNYTADLNSTFTIKGNMSMDNATTIIIISNITIIKIVDLAIAYPGDILTYTIYFNNTGGMNATFMWINDTLPAGVTFMSHTAIDPVASPTSAPYYDSSRASGQSLWFNFTDVPPGPHSFTITVQVNADVANNTLLMNWIFCNYTSDGDMRPETIANATTLVISPHVYVNKTVDLSEALPGDILTYTIWFNNTNATAPWVWINDTLPAQVTYLSDTAATSPTSAPYFVDLVRADPLLMYRFANVPFGSHSFTIQVMIWNSTQFCTWLNNMVTCNFSPSGVYTSDYARTHIIRPLINISKIANQTVVYPGEYVNYTIFFNNTDTAPAINVWINDTLPVGVTYIGDNANTLPEFVNFNIVGLTLQYHFMNVGPGNYSFNITIMINATVPEGMVLVNWVTIEYDQQNDYKYGPYLESASIIVIGGPLIEIAKLVSQDVVNTGETVTYWIFFNNTGNGNATFVWINDTLPAGVTYLSDTAGTTATHTLLSKGNSSQQLWFNFSDVQPGPHFFMINVLVTNDTDLTVLTNVAYCDYVSSTGISSSSVAWANMTVNRPIMTVEKTVDLTVVAPGDILTYTIWYNNTGSYPADVWINDTIPNGTWYLNSQSPPLGVPDDVNGTTYTWHIGIVPPNTSNSAWIQVVVNLTTPSGTYLNNTVELNYTCLTSGYEFTGVQASATSIVSALVVEKTVDLAFANPGDILIYTIYFNNTANFTIPFVWVNDTLPAGVNYIGDTASVDLAAIYAGSWMIGQNLYYNFTNVAPGSFNSFQITVQIDNATLPGTWLNNTVTLDYVDNVGNAMPSSAAQASTLVNRPIIFIEKTVSQAVAYQGDYLTYVIWFNNSIINATHVWI
ncbi:MAG: DUF11 domain-containing protein, partial [Thermoplasmata archaeon]|nr:DUF11 domain-containing protein [Thermoplasmata archaeon]